MHAREAKGCLLQLGWTARKKFCIMAGVGQKIKNPRNGTPPFLVRIPEGNRLIQELNTSVFLGLGSSLGDREAHLQRAIERLQKPELSLVACSSFYESPHLGLQPGDELRYPPHLNCVLQMETSLSPEALLQHLRIVEDAGGRQRGEKWAPRTIDIDILLFGESFLSTESLQIPHPGLMERAFVILPLRDLAPTRLLSGGMTVAQVAETAPIRAQIIRLYDRV